MAGRIAFRLLSEAIASGGGQTNMLPAIEKELLHYEILQALSEAGNLSGLVFQGGTALRLCYGAERLSEDLDFAGGNNFDRDSLNGISDTVRAAITRRYDVDVLVKEPKRLVFDHLEPEKQKVAVERWQIKVITMRGRPDIPQQLIKLEVALVPAYTRVIRPLMVNYPELPEGYANTLLPVESLSEILADKLIAFPTAKDIRYRDIWDLRWISMRPAQSFDQVEELVEQKVRDYGISDYSKRVKSIMSQIGPLVESPEFLNQMRRFVPSDTLSRTIERPDFRTHLVERLTELFQPYVS